MIEFSINKKTPNFQLLSKEFKINNEKMFIKLPNDFQNYIRNSIISTSTINKNLCTNEIVKEIRKNIENNNNTDSYKYFKYLFNKGYSWNSIGYMLNT